MRLLHSLHKHCTYLILSNDAISDSYNLFSILYPFEVETSYNLIITLLIIIYCYLFGTDLLIFLGLVGKT